MVRVIGALPTPVCMVSRTESLSVSSLIEPGDYLFYPEPSKAGAENMMCSGSHCPAYMDLRFCSLSGYFNGLQLFSRL